MTLKELKDEIGSIVCMHCKEKDECKVYECIRLKMIENGIVAFLKKKKLLEGVTK